MTGPGTSRLLRGTGPDLGPLAGRPPEAQRTLHHVLAAQVEERPEQDWLVFDGLERLTFAEGQRRMHRFADALRRADAGRTVALFLRNQVEFMPAFMGAQAAGGIAVPLNPELRGPLLERLLDRCGAEVLVVRDDLLPRLTELRSLGAVRLVLICPGDEGTVAAERPRGVATADFDAWLGGGEPTPPERLPDPWEVGALVFTSGTSGGSKAAVWSYGYLHLSSACVSDSLAHTAADVLSTPLQMCHIAGLQNFANSALQVGCTAHLKSRFSASGWWHEIAADGATFAMLMGQMAAMILSETQTAPDHRLSHVYILPQPQRREEFESRYGTKVIWQGWGMTEIFPHTPTKDPIPDVPADTIGPPPAWVDYGVVDEHDRLLPPGQLGQMVYRPLIPDAMASGYHDDPAATAAAFANFMFHTGDLGYYDEGGRIHFVMRNADAIRRRGENISAVELEAVTREHPDVSDAAAYAVPSELGEHEVKLDLVLEELADPDLAHLHAWLVDRLPRYMVPRYLERREAFPHTVSQRVEKYKLAGEGVERAEVREFRPSRRSSGSSTD
jgi:crotonobetaine/carnitine-CoA ligase